MLKVSERKQRPFFASANSLWMRQFFCCFLQMLSAAATIEVSVLYLQCSVPCHVNLLACTVFKNICFPFFLHKLTSISRQNWSCKEIPHSQNSDKVSSISSVVVNKTMASSVWKLTTVSHFTIKSRRLNTMKSFLTFKIINSGIFLYFIKVSYSETWQNTQFMIAILFCFIFTT